MAALPRARGIAALALAVSTIAACSSGTAGDDPAAEESGLGYGATTKCLSQQADLAYVLQNQVQRLTRKVLSEPDEVHADVVLPLRRALGTVEDRTRRACGDGRTPLVPLIQVTNERQDHAVDEPLLRRIVDAYEQWLTEVDAPSGNFIVYAVDPCTVMREQVQATYAVRTRPESGGTTVWVELVLTSDWPGLLYVEHGGSIHATRTQPGGADRTYQWGGSSADSAAIRPGRTTREPVWPAPQPDQYLHLLPGGTVRVSDVYASAYNTVGPCRIPVRAVRR